MTDFYTLFWIIEVTVEWGKPKLLEMAAILTPLACWLITDSFVEILILLCFRLEICFSCFVLVLLAILKGLYWPRFDIEWALLIEYKQMLKWCHIIRKKFAVSCEKSLKGLITIQTPEKCEKSKKLVSHTFVF